MEVGYFVYAHFVAMMKEEIIGVNCNWVLLFRL